MIACLLALLLTPARAGKTPPGTLITVRGTVNGGAETACYLAVRSDLHSKPVILIHYDRLANGWIVKAQCNGEWREGCLLAGGYLLSNGVIFRPDGWGDLTPGKAQPIQPTVRAP